MTAKIKRTIVQTTILHPADETPESRSLQDIAYQIDEGGWLGQTSVVSSVEIAPFRVQAESQLLGNDGSFFLENTEQ